MARPETLIPGNCYFSVGFYDSEPLVPMIETLVYIGQEDHPQEGRLWLFTEPESPPDPDEQNGAPGQAAVLLAILEYWKSHASWREWSAEEIDAAIAFVLTMTTSRKGMS